MEKEKWITPAWMQQALNGLRDSLDVNGELRAEMVQFLFDEGLWDPAKLSWGAAMNRFAAALNPGRAEVFKLVEIWALIKRFDRHALFHALADDLGYEVRRIPSEQRRQELVARLAAEIERSNDLTAQALTALGAIDRHAPPPRMHAALRDGSAQFAAREDIDFSEGGMPGDMGF